MNRRTFLKYGCAGLVSVALGSGIYSYIGLQDGHALRNAYREHPFDGLPDDAVRILYLASLAPSGHNTQPWRVRIRKAWQWSIGSQQACWLSAVDPDNRELLLSLGAFMENLSVAAGIYGYQAAFTITGQDGFSDNLVEVRLTPGIASGRSEKALCQRRTLRKGLTRTPLKQDDLETLIGNRKNVVSYYPLESQMGQFLGQLVLKANRVQTERYDARAELGEWIRWSDQDARTQGNGLTPDSMEMGGIAKWYAQYFMNKKSVHEAMFSEETIKLVQKQVENCAGWLLVRSQDSTVGALLETGRIVESIWLKARDIRIAVHPMTQPLEEAACKKELIETMSGEGDIQFIIRLGYVNEYPAPVSVRAPMEKFITI